MTPRCTRAPEGAAARAARGIRANVPELETARTRLVAPRLEHLPLWTRILSEDAEGHLGGPHGAEEAWEAFCVYTAGWVLHGHGLWAVERASDGAHLGFVLVGLEWDDGEPELGWMIAPEHRGQGYATEAATAARDHAARILGTGRFVSCVHPGNAASRRLAARLGATRDIGAEAAYGAGGPVEIHRHGSAA